MINNKPTALPPGVFRASRKDGTVYYRASLTCNSKHISLGSFATEEEAGRAYLTGCRLLGRTARDDDAEVSEAAHPEILDYDENTGIGFDKWVALINLRDNGIYCSGPIYLRNKYFDYYLDRDTVLRFDATELFYYTHHSIQRRGGHLFVADYGSQISVLTRYGIHSYSVCGRDYYFKNGDRLDFRSSNVIVINRYNGVTCETLAGRTSYTTKIHINGDRIVGRYDNETDAAIAYNKAADLLEAAGVRSGFNRNYLEDLSSAEYRIRYARVKVSKGIRSLGQI